MPDLLPIHEVIPQLRERLRTQPLTILQAPPGAGKSTVLPLELLDEQWLKGRKMVMLQPRRLAARAVAGRLAFHLKEKVGETAGYRIRFDNRTGPNTRIEVLTEGILTRMMQDDNALDGVGLVIFDEFHERSLHADLGLVLCRQIQEVLREDLRILIMSATLDSGNLSALLGNAPVIQSEGRQFPIDIRYLPVEEHRPLSASVAAAILKALREETGDILAFLPGTGDIHRTVSILEDAQITGLRLHPLYGDLPPDRQDAAILPDPDGNRKVVLATSIAETSLTIEGIQIVVDSGFTRAPYFDPKSGLSRLETVAISRDSADQRAGRAGRLGPGICYRLWSEAGHRHLQAHRQPEILSADLAPLALDLAQWGVSDPSSLSWPSPPPGGAFSQALEILTLLGALIEGKISPRGKEMLRLPTHPRISHLLLEGRDSGLSALAADIAALLEERDPLPSTAGADLGLRLECLRRWRSGTRVSADSKLLNRIERLAASWRRLLKVKVENHNPLPASTGRLIAAAYPERIALQEGKHSPRYKLSNNKRANLKADDPLINESWLAVAQMDAGRKEGRIFLAAPLDPLDLKDDFEEAEYLFWDAKEEILVGQTEIRLGNLPVSIKPLREFPEAKTARIICEAVTSNPALLLWSEETASWLARMQSLRIWNPGQAWPDLSPETLAATTSEWLSPFAGQIRKRDDFRKLDLLKILKTLIPWDLSRMADQLAPESITVPSGSKISLTYFPDGSPPVLAVRLQEVFGLKETPLVNGGKNPVMMHLLSPGFKPVQVTQDLKSFWDNTYAEVRKELRGRYTKHHWPEDPWSAEPVRGAKRRK
jgi:ATP-dependent helicase HrpB